MNPFQSIHEYEEYIYTLPESIESIKRSTLTVIRRGKRTAVLKGELSFDKGYRITIQERLSFDTGLVEIENYGYEIWHNNNKITWYDSQPHPNEPNLVSNFPHHKHIPPDIKHHRISAENMSFKHPNLKALIDEVEKLLESSK